MTSEVHHRHPAHGEGAPEHVPESAPLLFVRHMSVEEEDDKEYFHARATRHHPHHQHHHDKEIFWTPLRIVGVLFGIFVVVIGVLLAIPKQKPGYPISPPIDHVPHKVVPIEAANEHWLPLDKHEKLSIWFRTWGNAKSGVPLLFVHGGPGNAISDYHNQNKGFFSDEIFFVVEVDQRGTGKSQPSVRDSWENMQYYKNISIDEMAADFEVIRDYLGIEKWLVWGGSFGSTVGLNYGTRYPERCLGLILRGIYLDTAEEVQKIYSRATYIKNPKRLSEFDTFFHYAQAHDPDERLNPNDAKRILEVYERLIQSGDRYAIWHWHVFENNLMETEVENLLDPNEIDEIHFSEAQSVAFFETRLWLHGSYEAPSNLLSRVDELMGFPIWICQGQFDEVCPPQYARRLSDALDDVGAVYTMRSIPSGHEQSDPIMAKCLRQCLREFLDDSVDQP